MYNIEVDFEVFKELTHQRQSEADDYNNVIRRLLKLSPKSKVGSSKGISGGKSWLSEGVEFPHGTEFRGTSKGKAYSARIENGDLLAEGKPARGLSHAVEVATGTGRNGWLFWQCKRPADPAFKLVDQLRKKPA